MAKTPSRFLRNGKTLFYPTGLQILSWAAQMARRRLPGRAPGSCLGLTCYIQSPGAQRSAVSGFQPSLLPPCAEKKNSQVLSLSLSRKALCSQASLPYL
jgi:hypothetical protein